MFYDSPSTLVAVWLRQRRRRLPQKNPPIPLPQLQLQANGLALVRLEDRLPPRDPRSFLNDLYDLPDPQVEKKLQNAFYGPLTLLTLLLKVNS